MRLSRIEGQLASLEAGSYPFSAGKNTDPVVTLVTGRDGQLNKERRHITTWLNDASHLTIVDPYFFSFSGPNKVFRTQADYVKWLLKFIPKQSKQIEVFHLPAPNRGIRSAVAAHCKKNNISLKTWETNKIHDRVLIKDYEDAKVVGTSFGSFGNKIAFVLDLPKEDLKMFLRELHCVRTQVPPLH